MLGHEGKTISRAWRNKKKEPGCLMTLVEQRPKFRSFVRKNKTSELMPPMLVELSPTPKSIGQNQEQRCLCQNLKWMSLAQRKHFEGGQQRPRSWWLGSWWPMFCADKASRDMVICNILGGRTLTSHQQLGEGSENSEHWCVLAAT